MVDVEIGPAINEDAAACAAVHVAGWEETYRGVLPDKILDDLTLARREAQWRRWLEQDDGRFVRVARDRPAGIVGIAMTGPVRTVGAFADRELDLLYVLAARHDLGIGRALMEAVVADAKARGARALGFWAVRENVRARHFYERGGALLVGERREAFDGNEVVEVGYRLAV